VPQLGTAASLVGCLDRHYYQDRLPGLQPCQAVAQPGLQHVTHGDLRLSVQHAMLKSFDGRRRCKPLLSHSVPKVFLLGPSSVTLPGNLPTGCNSDMSRVFAQQSLRLQQCWMTVIY